MRKLNSRRYYTTPLAIRLLSCAAHAEAGNMVTLPRGATDRELLAALGPGSAHDETAVLLLED